jgi:hypothetical protein
MASTGWHQSDGVKMMASTGWHQQGGVDRLASTGWHQPSAERRQILQVPHAANVKFGCPRVLWHNVNRMASMWWHRQDGTNRVASTGWHQHGGINGMASTGWHQQDGHNRVASAGDRDNNCRTDEMDGKTSHVQMVDNEKTVCERGVPIKNCMSWFQSNIVRDIRVWTSMVIPQVLIKDCASWFRSKMVQNVRERRVMIENIANWSRINVFGIANGRPPDKLPVFVLAANAWCFRTGSGQSPALFAAPDTCWALILVFGTLLVSAYYMKLCYRGEITHTHWPRAMQVHGLQRFPWELRIFFVGPLC